MGESVISVEDVVYEYATTRALDGVSFHVPAQAVVALVGPNGAGKSTLLRCLAGLDRPFSGAIVLDGIDVAANPRAAHERIGFLSDFFGLYEDLTVAQSLRYAALARRMERARVTEAAERAAARVGLSDRMDERAGRLSRGLRQRLGIAMTIVHEPKVLLLDEPAAGLDPEARRTLSSLLLDLRDGGMTLIVSSHILSELEDYCDRMIALDQGRIRGGGVIERAGLSRSQLEVALAGPFEGFEQVARAAGADTVRDLGSGRFELETPGGPGADSALLAALVRAGAPVCAFTPKRRSLEDAYFEDALGRSRA